MQGQVKVCLRCNIKKQFSEFSKDKVRKSGYHPYCKKCKCEISKKNKEGWTDKQREEKRQYLKQYNKENFEQIKQIKKEYQDNNYEHLKRKKQEYIEKNQEILKAKKKIYRDVNKERLNAKQREYYRNPKILKKLKDRYRRDPVRRINNSMSCGIRQAIKKQKAGLHWESFVNYTIEDLITHLESKFKLGMTWNNYGKYGWHIDHIVPKTAFNITSNDCEDFKKCWSLNNLQPLWWIENLRKHNRIVI